jgi:mRNA-degrading endonuclease toxin of MazEF toxin-antitoxin module
LTIACEIPGNVTLRKGLGNIPKTSVVAVSQMATVDKARLLEKIGKLDKKTIERILEGCQMVIQFQYFREIGDVVDYVD